LYKSYRVDKYKIKVNEHNIGILHNNMLFVSSPLCKIWRQVLAIVYYIITEEFRQSDKVQTNSWTYAKYQKVDVTFSIQVVGKVYNVQAIIHYIQLTNCSLNVFIACELVI